jgi:hypothetical protein
MKRFALLDLLKSLFSDTKIFSKYIPGLNQILKRQTSRSHYGSKTPAVTITVFKYRNKIGKIVVKTVPETIISVAFSDSENV